MLMNSTLGKAGIEILERGVTAIGEDASNEHSKIKAVFKKIIGHPIKVLAAFIFAPILVIKVALTVKDPIRRVIAVAGLLLSLILSYIAATFLGTLAGSLFVGSNIGLLSALGFLIGTTISVYLSVLFLYLFLTQYHFYS